MREPIDLEFILHLFPSLDADNLAIIAKKYNSKISTCIKKKKQSAGNPAGNFELDFIEFIVICLEKHCFYCDDELAYVDMTLDRVDPELGYSTDNVVLCCTDCNKKKGGINIDEMRAMVERLAVAPTSLKKRILFIESLGGAKVPPN